MYVTREADYAVRCVIYLSEKPERMANVKEISESKLIPKSFLAKILQRLTRAGIVKSIRGVRGGFGLAKSPEEITLLEVIEAVQGSPAINECAFDKKVCNFSDSCSVHPVWVEIRRDMENRLRTHNFKDLLMPGRLKA